MDKYISIFLTFLLIPGLIIIYRKKDEHEEFLFIKLIIFYLIGSFRFNLNELAIPLGYIIYLVCIRPRTNKRLKGQAALVGLAFFMVGVFIPIISDYVYERPKQIQASSNNIYTMDFEGDWQLIKDKLKIDDSTRLEGLDLDYENDGTIKGIRYELIAQKEEGLVHYNVDFSSDKKNYIIRPLKIDQWLQYNRLVAAERFFGFISSIDLMGIKPVNSYPWYVIHSDGYLVNYEMKDPKKFIVISNGNMKEITNNQLPIEGFFISSFGMQITQSNKELTSYESTEVTDYFFDVVNQSSWN